MEVYEDSSLRGRVFAKLKEDILSGAYRENDELREITIGEEMGVSRTPVREALRQLELEGLVKIIPNKGAYVTGITPRDVKDIYKIRSMLEGLCARWATEHITPEQTDELEEILLLMEFHMKKRPEERAAQMSALDGRFHQVLYEASDSRILEHAEKSLEEHREILEAIKKKDKILAEKLANRHVMKVMENLHIEE